MYKPFISLLMILVNAVLVDVKAQPNKVWDKTFGGGGDEELAVIFQSKDEGYIFGGSTTSNQNNAGGYDFQVGKLNAAGTLVLQRAFGGDKDDILTCLLATQDGGFIVGGSSASGRGPVKSQNSLGEADYWIVKVNKGGEKEWDKRYGGTSIDNLTSMYQTSDGGYILGGYSWSNNGGQITDTCRGKSDYWIIKIDGLGNKLWDKRYGGVDFDELYSVEQTSDGGYILGGYSYYGISGDKTEDGRGNCDFWAVKTDASGNKIWDKRFGGTDYEHMYAMTQTNDNGYILAGDSRSKLSGDKSQNGRGKYDFWLVKLAGSGEKVWDKRFGGKEFDVVTTVKQTNDGGYVVGGESASGIEGDRTQANKGASDFWMLKLDADGNKIWDVAFGGSENDYLQDVSLTSDGGYILGGISRSERSGDKTQANKGGYDFWIIKAGSTTDQQETNTAVSKNQSLLLVPNPVSRILNIKSSNISSWQILNSLGNVLKQASTQRTFTLSSSINVEDLAPGLYYVRVTFLDGTSSSATFIKE
jgi:hypothetical protein